MASRIVVLDNGTGYVKAGFAGQNFPTATFPSAIGRPILRASESAVDGRSKSKTVKENYIGDEATAQRALLDITHPIENGVVRDWDDMCKVWDYAFQEKLGLSPSSLSSSKILLTEAPMNPVKNRERMVEVMFETFGFGHAYVAVQAVLTLYAQGLQTGVVVDSGDGVSHVVPVYEGHEMKHAVKRLDIAGKDVTRNLIRLLDQRGYAFNNQTSDFESIRELKEKLCYAGVELEQERRLALETTFLSEKYHLPDGRTIVTGSELFEAPEILFHPHLIGKECPGLSEVVFNSIQACEMDCRPDLYRHIVLSGGTTMLPGMSTRLERDIQQLYIDRILQGDASRRGVKIRVDDPPNRKHAVWIGGAVLADIMKANDAWWVSRGEWQEQGAACLSKLSK